MGLVVPGPMVFEELHQVFVDFVAVEGQRTDVGGTWEGRGRGWARGWDGMGITIYVHP